MLYLLALLLAHRFVCADYTQGKVFVIAPDGHAERSFDAPNANDVWLLPNGNLLFNTGHGVREVTPENKIVFSYDSASEIHAVQRLPDGATFVAESNAARLLTLDPSGRVTDEILLRPGIPDSGSAFLRNARRLPNGNTLVAHYGDQVVIEYDPRGRDVWQVKAPGGPHSAVRLPNGNTLISSADRDNAPARLFEVDPAGKTVWELRDGDLPGIRLFFLAGFHRLPNGNTVISNWLGHGHLGQAPLLLEITPGKRVVWSFSDHKLLRTASSVQLFDYPAENLH